MRTHPPSLLTQVRRTLVNECGVAPGKSVLVAVSGGPDSMALLHALGLLRAKLGFGLVACGVDHGLRAEAAAELDQVAVVCARLDVEFRREHVTVSLGGNLQARARQARYAALQKVRRELRLDWLATAHHADDRAETVLIRLLRGASLGGLAVLPPRSSELIRPLIRLRRTDVMKHVTRHGIAYSEDPSNADRRFLRTRIRAELLPLLEELSPGVVAHLNALADELQAPEIPRVIDDSGEPVRLGRAQREALQHALRQGSPKARVLLSGGKMLRVDPRLGRVELTTSNEHSLRAGRRRSSAGEANEPKKA